MVEYRSRRGVAIDWAEPVRPSAASMQLGPPERFEIRSRRPGRAIVHAGRILRPAVLSFPTYVPGSLTATTVKPRVTVNFP